MPCSALCLEADAVQHSTACTLKNDKTQSWKIVASFYLAAGLQLHCSSCTTKIWMLLLGIIQQKIRLRIWARSYLTSVWEKLVSLASCCLILLPLNSEMHTLSFNKFCLIYLPLSLLLLLWVSRAAKLSFRTQKSDLSLNTPSCSLPSFSHCPITTVCLTAFPFSFHFTGRVLTRKIIILSQTWLEGVWPAIILSVPKVWNYKYAFIYFTQRKYLSSPVTDDKAFHESFPCEFCLTMKSRLDNFWTSVGAHTSLGSLRYLGPGWKHFVLKKLYLKHCIPARDISPTRMASLPPCIAHKLTGSFYVQGEKIHCKKLVLW